VQLAYYRHRAAAESRSLAAVRNARALQALSARPRGLPPASNGHGAALHLQRDQAHPAHICTGTEPLQGARGAQRPSAAAALGWARVRERAEGKGARLTTVTAWQSVGCLWRLVSTTSPGGRNCVASRRGASHRCKRVAARPVPGQVCEGWAPSRGRCDTGATDAIHRTGRALLAFASVARVRAGDPECRMPTVTAIISTLTAIIGTLNAIIGTLTAITGTLTAIIGTLTAIIGTLNAIIGTLNAIIGTLTAIIGTLTAITGTLTAIIGTLTAIAGLRKSRIPDPGNPESQACIAPVRLVTIGGVGPRPRPVQLDDTRH
jgi:hypothetical protein